MPFWIEVLVSVFLIIGSLFALIEPGSCFAGSLLDKVEASVDLAPWLARVKPVDSLDDALAARASLGRSRPLMKTSQPSWASASAHA